MFTINLTLTFGKEDAPDDHPLPGEGGPGHADTQLAPEAEHPQLQIGFAREDL